MSNLREKAREIKAAGEAERGNFQPEGAPKRLYEYWLDRTRSQKGKAIRYGERKENFCHFWRVVLFWAPFMWVRKTAERVLTNPVFLTGLGIAALVALVVACIVPGSVLEVVGILVATTVGLIFAAGAMLSGVSVAHGREGIERYDLVPLKISVPWAIVGLPVSLPFFLLTKAIILYNRHLMQHTPKILLGVAALGLLGFYTAIGVTDGLVAMLMWIGTTLAVAGMVVAGIFAASVLSDYISGRRKVAEAEALQAREDYYAEHGEFPSAPQREPGMISKFFRGVGDFIILIAQVVRVNKWKICPMVEIER